MPSEYCDYILDTLAPLGGVAAKRMFGGFGLFRNGLMFGLIFEDTLFFKAGPDTQKEYAEMGAKPFMYDRNGKSVSLPYWNVPTAVLDDAQLMAAWAEKACRVSRAAQDKKVSKKKRVTLPAGRRDRD